MQADRVTHLRCIVKWRRPGNWQAKRVQIMMMMAQLRSQLRCGSVMWSPCARHYSTAHSVKVDEIRLLLVRKSTRSAHSGEALMSRECTHYI